MKKWEIQDNLKFQISPPGADQPLAEKFKVDDLLKILLKNRGLKTKKDIDSFLHPKLSDVTVEKVGIDKKQLTKTIKRIEKAIKLKEQIIVYGDYDVDGITGTAILWEALKDLNAEVLPYIPHRIDEGYGLSVLGIQNLESKIRDVKLIITVDNGIVANEAVEFANEKEIDVIITDHHLPHTDNTHKLPSAFSFVHTPKLCGAGVAYVLSKELQKYFYKEEKAIQDRHLELAALGTVADLVPLQGASRAIVKYGLEKLSSTNRIGLLALFKEAACDQATLGVYAIGHIIAPRLNASGRLDSAMDALRLICTKDKNRAEILAQKLGITNKERQDVMREAAFDAISQVRNKKGEVEKILIVAKEEYHEGVIGLVAGKLVEEFYRPAIVIAKREKYSKASVRSISGFNIIEFLRLHKNLLINVGGHPMAAGFTVETEKLTLLTDSLKKSATKILSKKLLTRQLKIDCKLPFALLTPQVYNAIQTLSPFGMANPEPVFLSRGVEIADRRLIGKEGKHLKLQLLQKDGGLLEAIAFGMGEMYQNIRIGESADIVYTLSENTWNGNTKLQLKIKDLKVNS